MSCRRARRQLLWLVRFGEFDEGSAPHLEHLAGCGPCRDEVGLDRALVRELRSALAERVADATPSPEAWDGVLARMRQPEPRPLGLRGLATRLAGALRAGTAMAGAGLALVLALNLEVVPLAPPPSETPQQATVRPAWAGDIPPFVDQAPPAMPPTAADRADESSTEVAIRPAAQAEQLPLGRSAAAEIAKPDAEPAPPAEVSEIDNGWQVLAVRLVPSDAARIVEPTEGAVDESADTPDPATTPPVQSPS